MKSTTTPVPSMMLTAIVAITSWGLLGGLLAGSAAAHPLPGQVLKFQQTPMNATEVDGKRYFGHDELSTLYAVLPPDPGTVIDYSGIAMADDFADEFKTPVVHVRWWGSYRNNFINPDQPVKKFMIAFESDVPADQNPLGFSHPGKVLSSQIVSLTAAPLARKSGTYTERRITANLPEDIYEYNAELHLGKDFPQDPDTVYWLKIAALVDTPAEPNMRNTEWGWHNRDYTVFDPLASQPPVVVPGEFNEQGVLDPRFPSRVWHFQDDAVSARTFAVVDPSMPFMPRLVEQSDYVPQRYLDDIDGPGPEVDAAGNLIHRGIGQFSKDLAFELYTIPEPSSLMLAGIGLVGLLIGGRRLGSRDA